MFIYIKLVFNLAIGIKAMNYNFIHIRMSKPQYLPQPIFCEVKLQCMVTITEQSPQESPSYDP